MFFIMNVQTLQQTFVRFSSHLSSMLSPMSYTRTVCLERVALIT